ncbi:uncharacterized protein PFL1_02166 [Pseudozyma flocculosa PF-1]|uniref:uncharacterized protein n=1 Tax=Pseudozyma flocculosa PF-1 TaxID=1277687 RepID=UPI00045603F5|nr:uncharacterized protein PFL1_02166 [Pseudozyma flocculosa PF-1]EPQ30049.1 hypothetical protein PFL1_02166 [Pseudozyma flocculosa PF-1]
MIGNIFSWGAAPNKRAADPTSSSASSRASANIRHRYEMPTPAQHRHSHRIDTLGPHRKYEISTSTGLQFDTLLRPTTASVNGGHVHVLLDEMCKQLRSQPTCLNAMAAQQESLNKTVKRLNAKVAAYSSTKPKDIGFHEPRDTPRKSCRAEPTIV